MCIHSGISDTRASPWADAWTSTASKTFGLHVSGSLTMRTLRVRWACSGEPLLPSELLRLLPRITPLAMAARSTCVK
jgi:hypothetical protein